MKKFYRVMKAVDYNGQKERVLFYTDNKELAESKYIDFQIEVNRFAKDNGLKTYNQEPNKNYMTFFADGNKRDCPYSGCIAEFKVSYVKHDNFLNLGEEPTF